MILTKYIAKTCIISEMHVENKADAIKELTHLLFDKKRMKSVGPALDQIMAREITESTGIGRGIAVPHARVPGMKNLACAIGRVKDGLDFSAVDRKPVQLIFLICYPPVQQTTYLNFVATVAKLLTDKKHLNAVLKAKNEEDMLTILEDASHVFTDKHEKQKPMKTDPAIEKMDDAHADMILLARLQLCEEMLDAAKSGKKQIKSRISNIRSMINPRILKHYDRLSENRAPALVPVEGDTCQGCFMKLSSQYAQQVRLDNNRIHTCSNCSRYIYVV